MPYVDGFVLPISRRNIPAYLSMSRKAGKIWKQLGALEYRECIGDDLKIEGALTFLKAARAKTGETVIFSWITHKSRAHRDRVNARVMKDPRILRMMKVKCPFDVKRMAMGGFKVRVDL